MPPLNLELDLEVLSDVGKVFNYLVCLLRNRNITQYIENHPAAYDEVLAAVHQIPKPRPLPTPAYTPREEPDPDSQADQHENNLVEPHNQNFKTDWLSEIFASLDFNTYFTKCNINGSLKISKNRQIISYRTTKN